MNFLLLLGIAIFIIVDQYIDKREKKIFLSCICLSLLLNIQHKAGDLLSLPEYLHLLKLKLLCGFVGYSIRPFLMWGLWEVLRTKHRKNIRYIMAFLCLANMLIFTTCFYSNLTFGYYGKSAAFYRGPLGMTCHVIALIMMFLFIPTLVNMYREDRKQDCLLGFLSLIIILIATLLDTYANTNCLNDVVTYECILYFMFFHAKLEQEYTRTLLLSQKAEMMLLQIKPHFINNTLTAIQELCESDPKLASRTIGTFARYLRENLSVMDKMLPVPVKEEIEHTKNYTEIEALRFPWIEFEYDIQDADFCVPALSIQPLVENAVRYGLRKEKQGHLLIQTKHTPQGHMILVIDNGKGFDTEQFSVEKGHGYGLPNVKYRVETMSHGTLTVESRIGVGTTARILIPD